MDKAIARSKKEILLKGLGEVDSLLVAFSGGVDSAFLLAAARDALGEKVVAATAVSPIHPRREQDEAVRFVEKRGIDHILFQTNEIEIPEFMANGIDRCYHCKRALSRRLLQIAEGRAIERVAHGANVDDQNDYRPGLRAAQEAGIVAPLMDAGLGKEEIRFLAKEMRLKQWDKPAMACLASRFPYERPITEKGLRMVEAAEEFLSDRGYRRVRVRHHGALARIEVDRFDLERIMRQETRKLVIEAFRQIGFAHIALDLEGYISGKMNRDIDTPTQR